MQMNPGGRRLASVDRAGIIKIWDAASGVELVTFSILEAGITAIKWTPNGKLLTCSCDDGTLRIFGSPNIEAPANDATLLESGHLASTKSPQQEHAEVERNFQAAVEQNLRDLASWRDLALNYMRRQLWSKSIMAWNQRLQQPGA